MDAAELVAWFRIIQTDPYYGTTIQARFELAADTIERLQKEIDEFNTEALAVKLELRRCGQAILDHRLVAINRALIRERDAALAEVERVNAALASRTRTVELLKQDLGLGVGT